MRVFLKGQNSLAVVTVTQYILRLVSRSVVKTRVRKSSSFEVRRGWWFHTTSSKYGFLSFYFLASCHSFLAPLRVLFVAATTTPTQFLAIISLAFRSPGKSIPLFVESLVVQNTYFFLETTFSRKEIVDSFFRLSLSMVTDNETCMHDNTIPLRISFCDSFFCQIFKGRW